MYFNCEITDVFDAHTTRTRWKHWKPNSSEKVHRADNYAGHLHIIATRQTWRPHLYARDGNFRAKSRQNAADNLHLTTWGRAIKVCAMHSQTLYENGNEKKRTDGRQKKKKCHAVNGLTTGGRLNRRGARNAEREPENFCFVFHDGGHITNPGTRGIATNTSLFWRTALKIETTATAAAVDDSPKLIKIIFFFRRNYRI